MRRTAASDSLARKPLTADDVRDSISELIEDPRVVIPDSQLSDAEDDQEAAFVPASRKPIIDRLTLSRQSTVDESVGGDSNVAFHAVSRSAATPGFRVPSLIRQATSNLSVSSERSASNSTPKESAVRRGGTGRSNIHAQAREAERRALLEKKEGKRKEALRKKVEGGRKKVKGGATAGTAAAPKGAEGRTFDLPEIRHPQEPRVCRVIAVEISAVNRIRERAAGAVHRRQLAGR